jgi:Prolipoprotein diacylglyceryl transferase
MHARQGHGWGSRLPTRWVRVGPGGRWAGFTVCGLVGLALATAWTLILAVAVGRPAWLVLVLAGAMVAALLAVAGGEALVARRPRLVCFHAEVAALALAAGAVALVGQPVLASLDIAVPGLAIFLACGRVGCFIAGCCHGRPASWGVRYGRRHVSEGLAPEYVGVPLLPVAALEAAALAVLAIATTVVVLDAGMAGAALAAFLLAHAAVRFWLEFLRGDEGRPHLAGLSEAQWTALVLTSGLCLAMVAVWPVLPWWLPLSGAGGLVAGVALVAARPERIRLQEAGHVRDLASIVRCAGVVRGGLVTGTTGLGVRVSASSRRDEAGAMAYHYAFSRTSPALGAADAVALGRIASVVGFGGRATPGTLYRSGNGVYHLLTGVSESCG